MARWSTVRTPLPSSACAVVRDRLAGQRLGPLRLLSPLGHGGFAPVWLAEESFAGKRLREVAVKLFFRPHELAPGSEGADRWCEAVAEEARALCRVEHPGVVRFYSLQRDDTLGLLGLAMEYVPGPNLEAMLLGARRLDEKTTLEAGISVAWALSAVHDAGLVHRDVKPANVVRGPAGYKLIDFGIFAPIPDEAPRSASATQAESRLASQFVGLVGTVGYIAPECAQLGAPATPASDLYALGVTLHRLMTGSLPPQSSAHPGAMSGEIGELVALLLRPEPLSRPRHADWVARELEHIAARRGLAGRSVSGFARLAPSPPAREGGEGAHSTLPEADPTSRREATRDTCPELCLHPPLVGRNDELATIRRAAEGMLRGALHVVLVTGPMGIGRTRLLDSAVAQTGMGSLRVLHARCAPERRQPLRPFIDALGALPTAGASELGLVLDAVEQAMASGWADGGADGGARASSPMPAGDPLEAIEDALLEASIGAPLLLVIDDLQWADPSTLQLLHRLAGRAGERGRLLVLGAVRDEPHPTPALSALLSRFGESVHPARRRLRLRPLSLEESMLVAQRVGPCSLELAQAVGRGAGGTPALVVHALLAWRELGALAFRGGSFHPADERALRDEVPGVADLLEARLAACFVPASPAAHAARCALSAVALHGGGLGADVVPRVLDQIGVAGRGGAEDAIDALLHAGILQRSEGGPELGFAQEMVRQAALNLMRHRAWFDDVHRALLDILARRGARAVDAAFLAAGYERVGDARKERLWLRRALDAAAAAGLFDEAASFGDRLAALTASPRRRLRVEFDMVRLAIRGRLFEEARRRLEAIVARTGTGRRREDGRPRALDIEQRICLLEVARGLGEDAPGDPTLPADADALGDLVLGCEARLALAGVSPAALGLALAGEAIALAARRGGALEFTARVRRLEINRGAGQCDRALANEDLRRALAIAASSGSTWHRIHIEGDLAIIEADLGQTEAAIARLERLAQEADARRMRGQERLLLQNLAALLLRQKRPDEAARAAGKAAELAANAGDPALQARALSVRADALLRMGAHEAALECADGAARLQERLGDPRRALTLLRRAEILEVAGCTEQALFDAQAARRVAEEHGEVDLGLSARLWEVLRLARRGAMARPAVERALAEAAAAPVTWRPLTVRLMSEVGAWLAEEQAAGTTERDAAAHATIEAPATSSRALP